MHTAQDDQTRRSSTVPGGAPRLPRLTSSARTEPLEDSQHLPGDDMADRPVGRDRELGDRGAGQREVGTGVPRDASGRFEDYFSVESLFATPNDPPVAGHADPSADPFETPYAVLGVDASASWEEVTRVRRQLVSKLHPDRYVGAEHPVRAEAERRVRDVNAAFAEIRRQRSGRSR